MSFYFVTTQHQQKSFLLGQILKYNEQLNRKLDSSWTFSLLRKQGKWEHQEKKSAINFFVTKSFLIDNNSCCRKIYIHYFMKLFLLDRSTFFRSTHSMHFIIISGFIIRFMVFLIILSKSLHKYQIMRLSVWYLTRHGCNIPATKLKNSSFDGVKRSLIADWRFKKLFEFGLFDFRSLCLHQNVWLNLKESFSDLRIIHPS